MKYIVRRVTKIVKIIPNTNERLTDEDTIALAGYEEFAGTADIQFTNEGMDLTITFAGDVFGEIYPFRPN